MFCIDCCCWSGRVWILHTISRSTLTLTLQQTYLLRMRLVKTVDCNSLQTDWLMLASPTISRLVNINNILILMSPYNKIFAWISPKVTVRSEWAISPHKPWLCLCLTSNNSHDKRIYIS